MVLGRAYQPPQRRPMDLACHHLETIWQENTTRETSQAVERRPRQILERHDMAEESTRQGNLETARWGLRPTTGHNGCLMMMMMINTTRQGKCHKLRHTRGCKRILNGNIPETQRIRLVWIKSIGVGPVAPKNFWWMFFSQINFRCYVLLVCKWFLGGDTFVDPQ